MDDVVKEARKITCTSYFEKLRDVLSLLKIRNAQIRKVLFKAILKSTVWFVFVSTVAFGFCYYLIPNFTFDKEGWVWFGIYLGIQIIAVIQFPTVLWDNSPKTLGWFHKRLGDVVTRAIQTYPDNDQARKLKVFVELNQAYSRLGEDLWVLASRQLGKVASKGDVENIAKEGISLNNIYANESAQHTSLAYNLFAPAVGNRESPNGNLGGSLSAIPPWILYALVAGTLFMVLTGIPVNILALRNLTPALSLWLLAPIAAIAIAAMYGISVALKPKATVVVKKKGINLIFFVVMCLGIAILIVANFPKLPSAVSSMAASISANAGGVLNNLGIFPTATPTSQPQPAFIETIPAPNEPAQIKLVEMQGWEQVSVIAQGLNDKIEQIVSAQELVEAAGTGNVTHWNEVYEGPEGKTGVVQASALVKTWYETGYINENGDFVPGSFPSNVDKLEGLVETPVRLTMKEAAELQVKAFSELLEVAKGLNDIYNLADTSGFDAAKVDRDKLSEIIERTKEHLDLLNYLIGRFNTIEAAIPQVSTLPSDLIDRVGAYLWPEKDVVVLTPTPGAVRDTISQIAPAVASSTQSVPEFAQGPSDSCQVQAGALPYARLPGSVPLQNLWETYQGFASGNILSAEVVRQSSECGGWIVIFEPAAGPAWKYWDVVANISNAAPGAKIVAAKDARDGIPQDQLKLVYVNASGSIIGTALELFVPTPTNTPISTKVVVGPAATATPQDLRCDTAPFPDTMPSGYRNLMGYKDLIIHEVVKAVFHSCPGKKYVLFEFWTSAGTNLWSTSGAPPPNILEGQYFTVYAPEGCDLASSIDCVVAKAYP